MEELNDLVEKAQAAKRRSAYVNYVSADDILAIAEAFRKLEQENSKLRQERAGLAKEANDFEAKLAELEEQESTVEVTVDSRGEDHYTFTINRILPDGLYELFTRPAPAAALADLAPDKLIADGIVSMHDCGVVEGWNDCCDAILRNIEELKCLKK